MAEAYGWGKFFGILVPKISDESSHLAGVDVYGVAGFYIPYFYAMSDQSGATISGMLFILTREGTWLKAFGRYIRHPAMLASLTVILFLSFP
jgi:hypothetical protein